MRYRASREPSEREHQYHAVRRKKTSTSTVLLFEREPPEGESISEREMADSVREVSRRRERVSL